MNEEYYAQIDADGHRLGNSKARSETSWQQFGLRITRQQAVRNQPLRLGFLNSDLPTAYCYLPTSFPLRAWRLGAIYIVEVVLLNILSVRI